MATLNDEQDPALDGELVASVSRSFALSLKVLPAAMRQPISLAYLLARLSDTLADAPQVEAKLRLKMLLGLDERIQGRVGIEEENYPEAVKSAYLEGHDHEGERVLLSRAADSLRACEALPPAQRKLVQAALEEIIRGQDLDLVRFGESEERRTLSTREELDEYTYLVAGCVGAFWTRLGAEVDPRFLQEGEDLEKLCELGVRYGKGLQLMNIYRDAGPDLEEGRCYLPAEVQKEQNLKLETLEEDPAAFREAWKPWRDRCEEGLLAGLEYTRKLRSARCRLASGLPALIGLRTLAAIDDAGDEAWMSGVKINRSEVKKLLLRSVLASLRQDGIFRLGEKLRG